MDTVKIENKTTVDAQKRQEQLLLITKVSNVTDAGVKARGKNEEEKMYEPVAITVCPTSG